MALAVRGEREGRPCILIGCKSKKVATEDMILNDDDFLSKGRKQGRTRRGRVQRRRLQQVTAGPNTVTASGVYGHELKGDTNSKNRCFFLHCTRVTSIFCF